jgi:VWFA-related protein
MVKFDRKLDLMRDTVFNALFFASLAFLSAGWCIAQSLASSSPQNTAPYHLSVPVDEVSMSFHAEGTQGEPIANLTLKDFALQDNGKPPRKILSFEALDHLPVHVGILIDTSRSARGYLVASRHNAALFATLVLDGQTDRAFVLRFDSESKILQDWTGNGETLAAKIGEAGADSDSRMGGTVLYDSLYKACRDQFTGEEPENLANVLLLFSDGLDNASHALLQDDVEMCQRRRVAIYSVSPEPRTIANNGQKILRELSFKTGGGLLFDQQDGHMISRFRTVVGGERGAYRLVYKSSNLKGDGKFHVVRLKSLRRGIFLRARTGYYAPSR